MSHMGFWRTNVSSLFDVRVRCTMSHFGGKSHVAWSSSHGFEYEGTRLSVKCFHILTLRPIVDSGEEPSRTFGCLKPAPHTQICHKGTVIEGDSKQRA